MSRIPPRIELIVPTHLVKKLEQWALASTNGSLTLHFHEGIIQKYDEHISYRAPREW